jgi:hypothetical protein
MGYTTKYDIVISGAGNANRAIKIAEDEFEFEYHDYQVFEDGTITAFQEGKWYDWEKEVTAISAKFPDLLIEIDGDGEESDDFWKARIKNGECEIVRGKIVYSEFKRIK